MTPEERQLIAGLFERVAGTGSMPRDPEAEAFIADAVRAQPHAPYVLTQTVLVQQQALENATKRIADLEAQLKEPAPQEETSFLGSIGRSLFGGGQPAQPSRPSPDAGGQARPYAPDPGYQRQPAYAPPPPQGGPWGGQQPGYPPPSGGGFLHNALTTAAGVAGGMVLAHSLGNLFGGGMGGLGVGGLGAGLGGGLGGGEVVNNFYESAPDPGAQHAADVLQDQDQDQDDAQDASYDDSDGGDGGGGDGDDGSFDT